MKLPSYVSVVLLIDTHSPNEKEDEKQQQQQQKNSVSGGNMPKS